MIGRAFIGTLLLAVGVTATDHVAACGDKYLNLGLGTHDRRSAAERRSAAILVYASAGSELSRLLTKLSVADAMTKVGYQPAIASSNAEFEAALRNAELGRHRRRWPRHAVGRATPAEDGRPARRARADQADEGRAEAG